MSQIFMTIFMTVKKFERKYEKSLQIGDRFEMEENKNTFSYNSLRICIKHVYYKFHDHR